jgi:hypothetical protein
VSKVKVMRNITKYSTQVMVLTIAIALSTIMLTSIFASFTQVGLNKAYSLDYTITIPNDPYRNYPDDIFNAKPNYPSFDNNDDDFFDNLSDDLSEDLRDEFPQIP